MERLMKQVEEKHRRMNEELPEEVFPRRLVDRFGAAKRQLEKQVNAIEDYKLATKAYDDSMSFLRSDRGDVKIKMAVTLPPPPKFGATRASLQNTMTSFSGTARSLSKPKYGNATVPAAAASLAARQGLRNTCYQHRVSKYHVKYNEAKDRLQQLMEEDEGEIMRWEVASGMVTGRRSSPPAASFGSPSPMPPEMARRQAQSSPPASPRNHGGGFFPPVPGASPSPNNSIPPGDGLFDSRQHSPHNSMYRRSPLGQPDDQIRGWRSRVFRSELFFPPAWQGLDVEETVCPPEGHSPPRSPFPGSPYRSEFTSRMPSPRMHSPMRAGLGGGMEVNFAETRGDSLCLVPFLLLSFFVSIF